MIGPDESTFHSKFETLGIPWLLDRTVGIFVGVEGGVPRPWGTAILLRIADAGFLVSASHVLDVDSDEGVLIGLGIADQDFVHLQEVCVAHTDQRVLDLAFVRLPREVDDALASRKVFVRLSDLDLGTKARPGRYAVYGFPQQTTRVDAVSMSVATRALCYTSSLYAGKLDDFEDGRSLALDYPPNEIVHLNGNDLRMPHLEGVSGCGMWRLYGTGDPVHRLNEWEPGWIRLTGIEHRVVGRKAIKGTLVRPLIEHIGGAHPDLRPAIELIRSMSDVG